MDKRSLPAVLESLADIRRYVKEAADQAGIEAAKVYQLQLAVDEIATNTILYGYKDVDPSPGISIAAEITGGALVITLEDAAPEFDPNTIRLPDADDLAKPFEEREIGGLGIFLAIKGVDRFAYRREDGRNVNVFEIWNRHD